MNKYSYDIAISLCSQDFDYARKLVKALNPSLKVFFYEDKQKELISKSGPEIFASTFKEQSRIVVILSRKEWGKTFYTEVECNAIVDRFKSEGLSFLIVIPMAKNETPVWYPSTMIYADPLRLSIEELAHLVEYKVVEKGGELKVVTVEDRQQYLKNRINEKKSIIHLQETKEAIQSARDEINNLKDIFNKKSEFLRKEIVDRVSWFGFSDHVNRSYLGLGNYLLECIFILPDEAYHRVVTTQDFFVTFELFQTFGESKKSVLKEQRLFYYAEKLKGWALRNLSQMPTNKETEVLFRNRDNSRFYDLTNVIQTETLVDNWFQKLLGHSTRDIEEYI